MDTVTVEIESFFFCESSLLRKNTVPYKGVYSAVSGRAVRRVSVAACEVTHRHVVERAAHLGGVTVSDGVSRGPGRLRSRVKPAAAGPRLGDYLSVDPFASRKSARHRFSMLVATRCRRAQSH